MHDASMNDEHDDINFMYLPNLFKILVYTSKKIEPGSVNLYLVDPSKFLTR